MFVVSKVPTAVAGLLPEVVRAPVRRLQRVDLGELHLVAERAVASRLLRLRRVQGALLSHQGSL